MVRPPLNVVKDPFSLSQCCLHHWSAALWAAKRSLTAEAVHVRVRLLCRHVSG